ncbi:serine hydrolase [Thalassotalea sp. PP2-459]|uniref:serine hydrolase domain-containing protein n=1 Tax=Thalassotalea sp. PP2-459 TaxID=1742724 RepID=UPI0009454FBB|nr:serine hydrolase domain-containing protein [Thalassotalea sp. PP2-459]OKY27350.1 D-alanyl-D-alanine carboxypeptidase [Thalassotalea sp. PP2-459]
MTTNNFLKLKLLLPMLSVAILSACGGSGSSSNASTNPQPTPIVQEFDYQKLIGKAINSDVPGIILAIDGPETTFLGAAGLANINTLETMQTYHAMPAGSAGKKATALLTALLHQDNLLDIDNTIDTWLPDSLLSQIEYSEQMTLRQLLNHTSGVYDYLDDRTSDEWFDTGFSDVETLKTDAYALQFALNRPAYFKPGEGFNYSNTGYLLAGLILDEVLGEHHHIAMRNRIIEPLGLNDTFYLGHEKSLGDIISGYVNDDGEIINTKPFYENVGVADAPLATTVTDLSTLLRAIMTDDTIVNDDIRELLLGEESINLVDATSQFYVGLGMFKNISGDFTLYHHGGEEAGYKTSNIYIQEIDTTVTTFFNCNGNAECMEQTDELVQTVLSSLLEE